MKITNEQPSRSKTLSDIARHYASRGLSIIPIRADGSKKPACKWEKFQNRIATDAELCELFAQQRGIAIIGGPISGNLLILDFEIASVYERWLEKVFAIGSHLLDGAPVARTPTGGYHVYLRCLDPVGGNMKLAIAKQPVRGDSHTLIETRGEGGYVVAPGSPANCHKIGKPYAWLRRGWIDHDQEPMRPEVVTALLAAARELDERESASPEYRPPPPIIGTRYGAGALNRILATLAKSQTGTRNDSLNKAAFAIGQLAAGGQLDAIAAAGELHAVALNIGLGVKETIATIKSGLTAGAKEPRGPKQ